MRGEFTICVRTGLWMFILCMNVLPVHGQTDTVSHIWVDKEIKKPAAPLPPQAGFFSQMHLRRIPMHHPQNRPLRQGTSKEQPDVSGLVAHLLEGLRLRKLEGRMPEDIDQSYDYFDLVFDILYLQGTDLSSLSGKVSRADIEWSWMESQLDLIVESGFSADNSRPYFRIRYLRLMRVNPRMPHTRQAMLLIPYSSAVDWLETLSCPLRGMNRSAREVLELELFASQKLDLREDTSGTPQRLSPRKRSYGQTPDWWIN